MAKIVLKKMYYTSITNGIEAEVEIPDDLVLFEVENQYCNTITDNELGKCYTGISRDLKWFEHFREDTDIAQNMALSDIDVIGDLLFFNLHHVVLKDIEGWRIITREAAHDMFGLRDMVVVQWNADTHRFSSMHCIREYYGDACIVADSIINHGSGEFVGDCMKTLVKKNALYSGQISSHNRSSHITAVADINTNPYAQDLYESTLKYVCDNIQGLNYVLPKYDIDMPYRTYRDITKRDVPTVGENNEDYARMQVHCSECMSLKKELPQFLRLLFNRVDGKLEFSI